MRATIGVLVIAGAVVPAVADVSDDVIKKAVFRLTTAYQCAPIIKDDAPYEWAKANTAELLSAAGVSDPTADELISKVEAQGRERGPLNEKLCRNMLANFK